MLAKIQRLKNWQASLIIALLGFAAYFDGLKNQFLGDDIGQIVNNPPVHSISHIKLFFQGSTFYIGKGYTPLYGYYFRPLMTTFFSLIYSIFGPHPFYFHLMQLILGIGCSIIIFLLFRFSFKPALSLFLALIYLVHPLNSENIFSIAALQDVLYMFFGLLGLYVLYKYKSKRSLGLVSVCFLLSLMSKETGTLFIIMALLYLYWYNRKRLLWFMAFMLIPTAVYLVLRIHAIGLLGTNPHSGPIDNLSLGGRLLTAPSIMLFYTDRFIFPLQLAHAYYWVEPVFSFKHVLIPLVLDLLIIGFFVYGYYMVRKISTRALRVSYLYFAVWAFMGLLLCLQIIPLDFTASETWFCFTMVGVLGMLGLLYSNLMLTKKFNKNIVFSLGILLIILFGIRTAIRGTNWSDINALTGHDVKVSPSDYISKDIVALNLYDQGDNNEAQSYAEGSVKIFPIDTNEASLGFIDESLDENYQAYQAFLAGINHLQSSSIDNQIYSNLAILMLWYGNQSKNVKIIKEGIERYPHNSALWLSLAIIEYRSGDEHKARKDIVIANRYNSSTQYTMAETEIMNNKPLSIGSP